MAQAQRNDIDHGDEPQARQQAAEADRRHAAGGPLSQLQADLAQRLVREGLLQPRLAAPTPIERTIRFLSVAGGYGALLMGYVGVTLAITFWMHH